MKSIIKISYQVFIIIFVLSACEREWTSPLDPDYEVPPPTLLSVEPIIDPEPLIEIKWKNNEEHTETFDILRKTGSEGFQLIGAVSKDHLSYIDKSCTFEVVYGYTVVSVIADKISIPSNHLSAPALIPQPAEVRFIIQSDSEISITWDDNCSVEEGFMISRNSGTGFVDIGTVEANVTEYTDSGLTFGETYDYRVAAFTSVNTSSWATIIASTEFPAPSDLTVSGVSDSEIRLTWIDNNGYETGFKIERDDGSGFTEIGMVSANVTEYTDSGLTFGETYDYRVAAFTSVNTSSWATIIASTEFPAPSDLTVSGVSDSEIRLTWIDNNGYETGFKIERDDGSGFTEIGMVSANVTEYTDSGLTFDESYDYRVAAYTATNTSNYSATATATTITPMVDWDGNTYGTVEIGNQVWMAENLKVTHYRDGTPITNVTDSAAWVALRPEAYYIYNNNASNELDTYGALYNWYAVNGDTDGDGVKDKEIAPEGWHVPTDDEWTTLTNHLGGAGGKLKETGINHWSSPNTGATNESGFTALPGGYRNYTGYYLNMGLYGYFWSATETYSTNAWYRRLNYSYSDVTRDYFSKRAGFSVRCVRD